jgi:hypothetical protein
VLGQVGKRETFLRTFKLNEIAIELDLVVFILANSESQENGGVAGIAFVDETDVFGFVAQQ